MTKNFGNCSRWSALSDKHKRLVFYTFLFAGMAGLVTLILLDASVFDEYHSDCVALQTEHGTPYGDCIKYANANPGSTGQEVVDGLKRESIERGAGVLERQFTP